MYIIIFIACMLFFFLAMKHVEKEERREKERIIQAEREALEKKRQAEQAAREKIAAERAAEEQARLAAKRAAYQAMIDAIETYPVTLSDNPAKKQAASHINDLTYSSITAKTNMDKIGNFVVIDTETTGLKYTSSEIIEIAAIRFRDFKPVMKISHLLGSHQPIPDEVSMVNHITDEMIEGKPFFQEIAESLLEFIGNDNIVGHNLPFDLKFIVHYGADVTVNKRKYYDTMKIAQRTIKKARMKWDREFEEYIVDPASEGISDYKLKTLCFYLGITHEDAHRAEGDALATGLLFHKLVEMRIGK